MDKISKILITTFFLIVLVSVAITFYRYIVLEDINFYIDEKAFNEALLKK
jgi:uncharacterized protein YxeA